MTMMRVSKDPGDKAYSETAGQRRVWYRDQEVLSWITADEFRRVVITSDNRVLNGPVLIERLASDAPPPSEPEVIVPVNTGFMGMLVHVPDVKPESPKQIAVVEPVVEPAVEQIVVAEPEAPVAPMIEEVVQPDLGFTDEDRPGLPDPEVEEVPSERLPESSSQD